jgi:uncharacterized protein
MYFLSKVGGVAAQNKLWNLILAQRIGLHFSSPEEAQQMYKMMNKYHDLLMDIADASLVVVAQNLGLRKILTLDRDFFVYRLEDSSAFQTLM